MTVLIVNDEKMTADAMKQEVDWGSCGIDRVLVSYDAASARGEMLKGGIDILLLDIEMPRESGIDLMRWVREQDREEECIFLTCHASFTYAQEAVKLGCVDYVLLPARKEEIEGVLRKVVARLSQRREGKRLEAFGALWVEQKKEEAAREQGGRQSPGESIAFCKRYIQENLEKEALSVNLLADECHLNAIYLNRIFRAEVGMSMGQYIIRQRMELARELLKDPSLSAQTVALRVGYRNYPYFSTAYKKFFGCTPAQAEGRRGNGG